MFCGQCGTKNEAQYTFCKNCGTPLMAAPQEAAAQPDAPQANPDVVFGAPSGVPDTFGAFDASNTSNPSDISGGFTAPDMTGTFTAPGASGAPDMPGEFTMPGATGGAPAPNPLKKYAKRALGGFLAFVAIAGVGLCVAMFFGRDIAQLVQGDKYARNFAIAEAEKVLSASVDYIEESAAQSSGKTSASYVVDANIPEDYIGDILAESGMYQHQAYEILRLLGASRLEINTQIDPTQRDIAASVSSKWKVQNQDILDMDFTLVDRNVYIKSPQLYDETIGINVGDGMDEILSDLFYYNFDLDSDTSDSLARNNALYSKAMASIGTNIPKLEPGLQNMLRAGMQDLDYSLEQNVVVPIGDKSAKFDAVVISMSEAQLMEATATSLEMLVDDAEFISTLSSLTRDISTFGMEPMTASTLKNGIREAVSSIRDMQKSGWYSEDILVDVRLYVDAGNNLRGVSVTPEYGESMGFVYKLGTGYEIYYGENMRVYGALKWGFTSIRGDAHLYYSEEDWYSGFYGVPTAPSPYYDVPAAPAPDYDFTGATSATSVEDSILFASIEPAPHSQNNQSEYQGKLCEFTISGSHTNAKMQITTKMADILAVIESGGDDPFRYVEGAIDLIKDLEITADIQTSRGSSQMAVTYFDTRSKAKLYLSAQSKVDNNIKIKADDNARAYSPSALMTRIDFRELANNARDIADTLEGMGFDIFEMFGSALGGFDPSYLFNL